MLQLGSISGGAAVKCIQHVLRVFQCLEHSFHFLPRKLKRLVFIVIFPLQFTLRWMEILECVYLIQCTKCQCMHNHYPHYLWSHYRLTNEFDCERKYPSAPWHITLVVWVYTSHRWYNSIQLISLPQTTLWRPLGLRVICGLWSTSCLEEDFWCGPSIKLYVGDLSE